MRVLRTFSMPELETYEKFKELVEREGSNVSKHLYEFMRKYVAEHSPGNPQLNLGKFTNPPLPKTVCPDGERGWCPRAPKLCVKRVRYACKYGG